MSLLKKLAIALLLTTWLFSSPILAENTCMGINFWSISKGSPEQIKEFLNYLSQNMPFNGGTQLIRIWGYESTLGIDGYHNLQKVLDAAAPNQKFVVSLEDFPHGPAVYNPKEWFESGYLENYRDYVSRMVTKYKGSSKIGVCEIMN